MNQVTRPAPGSSTEKEMSAMAEEELSRLQRQLRIMEDDRMAFSDETSLKLEKQRKIIDQLKKEKMKLCEDINVANCENQKRRDKKMTNDIYKLLNVYENCCGKVRSKKEEIVEMDVQIKKLDADIKNLRPKSSVTENHYQNRLTSGQKSLQILKSRLDNMVKKFCAILAANKELREEINHLLKERNNFNETWEQLIKDLNSGKRTMMELIEQATIAFDQREEWCSKLEALKKRAEVDFILHSEEMREVQRKLDHYMTLREFLCVKGQKRILRDLEEKERLKKEMQDRELEDQLQVYEDALRKIQQFCDEEDVDRIASQYLKQEEENFALFNYVNELGHEIETLNGGAEELQGKIDDQMEISDVRAKERHATMAVLQNELQLATNQANDDQNKLELAELNLKTAMDGIEKIFDMLQCDKGPMLKLLGECGNINLFNLNIYLGTIEKRLSAIITELYFAEKSILTFGKKFKAATFKID